MTSQKELEVLFYQKRVNIESHIENNNKKKLLQKGNEEPALNFTLEGMLKIWRANCNRRSLLREGQDQLLAASRSPWREYFSSVLSL